MNKLQEQIREVEKRNGTEAYLYSARELGFDTSKKLKEIYAGDVE